ncbi:MAG: hypothetical protein R3A46_06940 [Thermomicrobiales bacterium]
MTIRRVDFAQVKAGRLQEYVEVFDDMKQAMSAVTTPMVRLMLINHGENGPANLTTGHCYSVTDFESAAKYGEFMNAAREDEGIQKVWRHIHSADSPVVHRGSGLLHQIDAGGAPAPGQDGSVSFVRAWKIAPGMMEVARAAGAVMNKHAEDNGGHYQVMRPMVAPSSGPNVIVSFTFPDWAGLGALLDEINDNPEIQKVAESFRSATPPGVILGAGIATRIAS